MMETQKKRANSSLLLYLLLANGITWLCWIPGLVIGAQQGYAMPIPEMYATLFRDGFVNTQHMLLAIAFQLGVYGPLIAVLAAVWMKSGREGLRNLWESVKKWKIAGRWYLTALLLAVTSAGLPVLIFGLVGGFTPGAYSLAYLLFMFVLQLFTSGLGEEPGWRGFLLTKLKNRFEGKGNRYIWVLGFIWAIWHYPIVIIQSLHGMPDVPMIQVVLGIVMNLAGFTMSVIGETYLYVWLYNQTGSVFLAIWFHAFGNTFNTWFLSYLAEPAAATLFTALMPWFIVIVLQRTIGKDFMLRGPAGEAVKSQ